MGRIALILVATSLAFPAAAQAGGAHRQESEKVCRVKERADPTNIRQQVRKPVNPTEKRYILM